MASHPPAGLNKRRRPSFVPLGLGRDSASRQAPNETPMKAKAMEEQSVLKNSVIEDHDEAKPPQPLPISPDLSEDFSSVEASLQRRSSPLSVMEQASIMLNAINIDTNDNKTNEIPDMNKMPIKTAILPQALAGRQLLEKQHYGDRRSATEQQITFFNVGGEIPGDFNPSKLQFDKSTGIYHTADHEAENYVFIPAFLPYSAALPGYAGFSPFSAISPVSDDKRVESHEYDLSVMNMQNGLIRSLNC